MKRKIRITEAGLRRVISNSVRRILKEDANNSLDRYSKQALDICRKVNPYLKRMLRGKQLDKFIKRVFPATTGMVLTQQQINIIYMLAKANIPNTGNAKNDYETLIRYLSGRNLSAFGYAHSPLVYSDRTNPNKIVGVSGWLVRLYECINSTAEQSKQFNQRNQNKGVGGFGGGSFNGSGASGTW